jgi:D-3-phosphoglycerate dehydrogenase
MGSAARAAPTNASTRFSVAARAGEDYGLVRAAALATFRRSAELFSQRSEVTVSKTVLLATEKPFSPSARDQVLDVLKRAGYATKLFEKYTEKGQLVAAMAEAEAVIVRSDIVDAEVLSAGTRLKLVVRAGAGYDNVDCDAAKQRGVAVMNTPGQNANAVAELVFGLMVYVARGKFDGGTGTELRGKTLGIHAMGAVGRAVSAIAQGFGMRVRAYDPFVDAEAMRSYGAEPTASVEELYRESQYVSLHVPATDQTKKSIGKRLLLGMPPGATLVNTARKEVIHEAELLEVFAQRNDFRYVTDIGPGDDTLSALAERYEERFYMTPKKMGAQTQEANVNAGVAAAQQIVGFFERGERQFVVNA